jgi:hypothetical protein
MESSILPIGDVLPVDADGYLINPCRADLLVPPWSDVVAEITAAYLQHLAKQIHSIYLRGSVAKGRPIAGVSDIDTFAVMFGERDAIDRSWVPAFQQRMAAQYPFHTGIEIGFVPYRAVLDPNGARGRRLMIKTQCICLWGEDLAPSIPGYKLGRALVMHAFGIERDIQRVFQQLPILEDADAIKGWCQWIMKRLLRTGFELVMEQERTYTRDLYPCYVAFSRHFPAQEPQMKHALERAIAPSDSKGELAQFLKLFGAWMIAAVVDTFPPA